MEKELTTGKYAKRLKFGRFLNTAPAYEKAGVIFPIYRGGNILE